MLLGLDVLIWEAVFKWEVALVHSIQESINNIVPVQSALQPVRATCATTAGSRGILRPTAGGACATKAPVRGLQWYRDHDLLGLRQWAFRAAGAVAARAAAVDFRAGQRALFRAAGALVVEELAVVGASWRVMSLGSAHLTASSRRWSAILSSINLFWMQR